MDFLLSRFFTGTEPWTVGPLAMGVTLLVVGGLTEVFTSRAAILPPRLFKVSFQLEVSMFS